MSANTMQPATARNVATPGRRKRLKQISAWVDPDLKEAFHLTATENNTSESALLNRILLTFLRRNPVDGGRIDAGENNIRRKRVTIRLTVHEEAELAKRATALAMSRSRYLASLFRTHISSAPYFSDEEINILKELARQMAGIGRNINQIAKALNTSLDNAHLVQAVELKQVHELIMEEHKSVVALIRQNMSSWQSENHNK